MISLTEAFDTILHHLYLQIIHGFNTLCLRNLDPYSSLGLSDLKLRSCCDKRQEVTRPTCRQPRPAHFRFRERGGRGVITQRLAACAACKAAGVRGDAEPAPRAAQGGGDASPVKGGAARPAEPAQGESAAYRPPTPPLPPSRAPRLPANPKRRWRPAAARDPSSSRCLPADPWGACFEVMGPS